MTSTKRLALLTVSVGAAMAASAALGPPFWWILAAVSIVASCVGSDYLIHDHWRQHRGRRRYDLTLAVFPALVVAAGFLVLRLPFFETGVSTALGVAAATVLFGAVVLCQLHSLSPESPNYRNARFALNLLAYVSAFGLYSAIYAPRMRSAYSATAVTLVTFLICLELFRGHRVDGRRALTYAAVLGLVVGETAWALNYWLVSALAGGLLLLVVLYVGAGITQSHVNGQLNRRTVLEFSGVGSAALAIVLGIGLLH